MAFPPNQRLVYLLAWITLIISFPHVMIECRCKTTLFAGLSVHFCWWVGEKAPRTCVNVVVVSPLSSLFDFIAADALQLANSRCSANRHLIRHRKAHRPRRDPSTVMTVSSYLHRSCGLPLGVNDCDGQHWCVCIHVCMSVCTVGGIYGCLLCCCSAVSHSHDLSPHDTLSHDRLTDLSIDPLDASS